jgi:hypothetical protein
MAKLASGIQRIKVTDKVFDVVFYDNKNDSVVHKKYTGSNPKVFGESEYEKSGKTLEYVRAKLVDNFERVIDIPKEILLPFLLENGKEVFGKERDEAIDS